MRINYIKSLLDNVANILDTHQVDSNTFNLIQSEITSECNDLKFNFNRKVDVDSSMLLTDDPYNHIDNLIISNNLDNLKEYILQYVGKYLDVINVTPEIKPFIEHSWMTKTKFGSSAEKHEHGLSFISGVYYYKVNERSGNLRFHPPEGYPDIFKNVEVEMQPKNGKIVIFPGCIPHSVLKNQSSDDRYSISFNVRIFNDDV
jgi:hypothetical protein